ncbi:hypothetical protein Tco_0845692 [Tanacetum coccineum]
MSTRTRSTETYDGLAAIQAQLNNLGREIKKVNEKVFAAQVGCELCKGPYYTKDCPLKEEEKTLEEAYYTQFGVPFQQEGNIGQQLRDSTKETCKPFSLYDYDCDKEKGSYGLKDLDAYLIGTTLRNNALPQKEKTQGALLYLVILIILREMMELDLEARLMGETLILNRLLDPLYGDYIELNDLNEPLELRRNQVDDLKPTIEEVEVVDKPMFDVVKTRNDNNMVNRNNGYTSYCDFDRKIHIDFVENMDAYRNEGMREVIVGEPFCKASFVEARRFDGMITILMVSEQDKMNGILHSYQKLKGFYKGILDLNLFEKRRLWKGSHAGTLACMRWNEGPEEKSNLKTSLQRKVLAGRQPRL